VVRPGLATLQILPAETSAVNTQVARRPKFAARRNAASSMDLADARTGRPAGLLPRSATHRPGAAARAVYFVTTGRWSQN
jgi:hypothetical protein